LDNLEEMGMAVRDFERFFVLTGGPGSGKSTLLAALTARGIRTMPESGRAIIQDQVAIGGNALPWGDRLAFAELMLSWEMRSYREALMGDGPVVFDRGVPDVLAYVRLCGLSVPAHIERAAQVFRYHPRVFIASPWEEIFGKDAERKQSFEEAERTYRALADTYTELGYELIALPLASVDERVQFVLSTIG
jgi:predicted ATPase